LARRIHLTTVAGDNPCDHDGVLGKAGQIGRRVDLLAGSVSILLLQQQELLDQGRLVARFDPR